MVIQKNVIESNLGCVFANLGQMFLRVKSIGLARLRHQVSYEDLGRSRLSNCIGDSRNKQIRQNTGIERTRSDSNQVRVVNCREGAGQWFTVTRFQAQRADWRSGSGDLSFTVDGSSIFQLGDKSHVSNRRRINVTFAG